MARRQTVMRSLRPLLVFTLLIGSLASCTTSSVDRPSPGVPTVVTSVAGTIVGYAGGDTAAALADVLALGGNSWVPFGVAVDVSAAGIFHASLPDAPSPGDGVLSGLCVNTSEIPTLSFLFTFTG